MARATTDPWQVALDALARRDRTCEEIRRLLRRRKVTPGDAEGVVARLVDRGYVNDRGVAYNHARYRREQGRRGPLRVRSELLARGIDAGIVDEVVREEFPADDTREAVDRAAERLAGRHGLPRDRAGSEKLARRLVRAGFPRSEVFAWLARGPELRDAHDDVD